MLVCARVHHMCAEAEVDLVLKLFCDKEKTPV